jgi:Endonuclease NucS
MKRVHLWSVRKKNGNGNWTAGDVPSVDNTETESLLESLLVDSPRLLMDGLTLVGRQVPTEGGPLDLLGVDQDGRLVVFELKRGTLTREAVAQVLDYASDLAGMDTDRFAKLIEDSSGKNGIDKISDFVDWYSQTFPNRDSFMEEVPRMVMVGLGVDARALRVVDFLASAGVDISLLTFNAFKREDGLFLARQVESITPTKKPGETTSSQTKDSNLQALRANAAQLGVAGFIEEVADFVEKRVPGYRWPGKTNFAFSLNEHTDQGRPTLRVYVNVALNYDTPKAVKILFQERAVEALGENVNAFPESFPNRCKTNKWNQLEITASPDQWPEMQDTLDTALRQMVDGWKQKATEKIGEQGQQDVAQDEESAGVPSPPVSCP